MAKDPRFDRLPCMHRGTYADDCIVHRIQQVVFLFFSPLKSKQVVFSFSFFVLSLFVCLFGFKKELYHSFQS